MTKSTKTPSVKPDPDQPKRLRLWASTDHNVHYPVGGASIVLATTESEAKVLMLEALRQRGLTDAPFSLFEIDVVPGAHVLRDGDH